MGSKYLSAKICSRMVGSHKWYPTDLNAFAKRRGQSIGCPRPGTRRGAQRVEKLRHASQKCKHFFEGMQAAARTSSGQSPHRSPRPDGQGSLRSLAPSPPKQTRFAGLCLGSRFAHLRPGERVFRRTRRRKTRFDPLPPSADGGTLRGSCSINRRNILY